MLLDSLQAKPAPLCPSCGTAAGPQGAASQAQARLRWELPQHHPALWGPPGLPPNLSTLQPVPLAPTGLHTILISMERLLWAGPREWHPTHKQTDAFPATLDLACPGRLSFELCAGHQVSSGDRDIVPELVQWSHNLVTILKTTELDTFKRVNFMACDLYLSF